MRYAEKQMEMQNPYNAQGGQPKYIDTSAETASRPVQSSMDVPAYEANNVRYWEYR
jgi:hypothetical protein